MKSVMDPQVQLWMPAILALFGSLIVVVLTARINTSMLSTHIDALRSEMKQGFAELELRLTKQILGLDHRIERLEEQRRLIRTP